MELNKILDSYKLSLTDDEITCFYQILEEAANTFDEESNHYNMCSELMVTIDRIDRAEQLKKDKTK